MPKACALRIFKGSQLTMQCKAITITKIFMPSYLQMQLFDVIDQIYRIKYAIGHPWTPI
jgi:hypothetical protein